MYMFVDKGKSSTGIERRDSSLSLTKLLNYFNILQLAQLLLKFKNRATKGKLQTKTMVALLLAQKFGGLDRCVRADFRFFFMGGLDLPGELSRLTSKQR